MKSDYSSLDLPPPPPDRPYVLINMVLSADGAVTVEGGRHIGNVMYYGYDPQRRDAELGITIGDRDYWSRGYGSDAVRALLGHLFRQVGMLRIYLHTLTWNERARRSFERAGFRRIDIVQRAGHEFVRMEITRDEYLEQERRRATDHGG